MFDFLISALISKRTSSPILGWLLAGALLLAMLYSANLTAYHAWAAGFATPERAGHGDWASRFFLITLVLLASEVGVLVWLFRKRNLGSRSD